VASTDESSERVFAGLQALKNAWPMTGWSWDSRLSSVASSFATHHIEAARAAIAPALPTIWTRDTIGSAPERVRALADRYDGVRKGQMLVTSSDLEGLLAFGLWWPWEESTTISFRVGLAEVDPSQKHYARLFAIFGVSTAR